jgi:small subunit ribosomal protein S3
MGQKVRPTGFRTGIMVDWLSNWYADKQHFSELLVEDQKIRQFIRKNFGPGSRSDSYVARIRIHRTADKVTVYIHSGKVGMLIGKKGEKIDRLTADLERLTHRRMEVKTMEVGNPHIEPQLVAQDIAEQLQKRASFRRTMKKAIDTAMEEGARGIKIQLAGRLGGSEMARTEVQMSGRLPLSTLRAKIDYGFTEAKTAQGHIGIKVWINNGDYLLPEENSDAPNAQARQVPKKPTRQGKR